jgi:hypothetical protein
MHLNDDLFSLRPNKLIPGSFTRPTPFKDEVQKARNSLAYWWYRALGLNEGYLKCCELQGKQSPYADLYADMGDVRLPFGGWWLRYGRKATDERAAPKEVIRLEPNRQADQMLENQDVLVLAIPLNIRKVTAMRKLSKLLAEAYAERPPLDIWKASTAKRMIIKNKIRKQTIVQLITLRELRGRFPNDSLFDLGKRAGIELDLLARDTSGEVLNEGIERRRMTIAVSRLLKQADNLIENAGLGVFPSLKTPAVPDLSV